MGLRRFPIALDVGNQCHWSAQRSITACSLGHFVLLSSGTKDRMHWSDEIVKSRVYFDRTVSPRYWALATAAAAAAANTGYNTGDFLAQSLAGETWTFAELNEAAERLGWNYSWLTIVSCYTSILTYKMYGQDTDNASKDRKHVLFCMEKGNLYFFHGFFERLIFIAVRDVYY